MAMAYNPSTRENDFQVRYVVNTTGDRWFIPYNNNKTTATQLAGSAWKVPVLLM